MFSTAGQKRPRRPMSPGDWINASVILVIGIFLGIAAHGVMRLVTSGLWASAVFILLVFAVLFAGLLLLEKLSDKLFPDGIRPAKGERNSAAKPLGLLLSLPLGGVIGFVLGLLNLATPLLELLP